MKSSNEKDLFQGIRDCIDFDPNSVPRYRRQVASKNLVVDIGGRNHSSRSYRGLVSISTNPHTRIVSTDIDPEYGPDLVDDICNSKLASNTYDGVNCASILEHVEDYQAAVDHIHRILKPEGEVFIYVPFAYCFHDEVDHHRFTFVELHRVLKDFSERRILIADGLGYGGVLWLVLTFFQIRRFPRLWRALSKGSNLLLSVPLALHYFFLRLTKRAPKESLSEYLLYYTQLFLAHGFGAWAKK